MSGQSPFSLFGSSSPKKPSKNKAEAPIEKKAPPVYNDVDPEIALSKMKKMHRELEAGVEDALKKSGYSVKEIEKMIDDPSQLTASQKAKVIQDREELEIRLTGSTKVQLSQNKRSKDQQKMSKDRKGKTLGSRKKWLDMH